jgi:hypothetical protein
MDALAGYGSDSSSSSSEGSNGKTNNHKSALSGLLGSASDDSDEQSKPQSPPPPKRLRMEETQKLVLPPPPLDKKQSMIYWDVNYLVGAVRSADKLTTTTSTSELSQKLEGLANSLKVSWADHLKAQHEFHNPHFFESVVEHFGIAKPLGSQIRNDVSTKEYELDLFPKKRD